MIARSLNLTPLPLRPQSGERWLVWLPTDPLRGVAPPRRAVLTSQSPAFTPLVPSACAPGD
eukprot:6172191-Pleurochrysis_carterae.AAC.1